MDMYMICAHIVHMHNCKYVFVFVHVYKCACVCMFMCKYVYVYRCICVRVHLNVKLGETEPGSEDHRLEGSAAMAYMCTCTSECKTGMVQHLVLKIIGLRGRWQRRICVRVHLNVRLAWCSTWFWRS